MLEIFKLIKGFTAVSWTRFFTRIVTRGHNWKLMKKHNCCDLRHHFLFQRAVNRWNSLSQEEVNASSVNLKTTWREGDEARWTFSWTNSWSSSPMAARPVTEDNGDELPCEESLTRCSCTW